MAQQPIHEGTPRELAPYLAQNPEARFRLIEISQENEEPTPNRLTATMALMKSWLEEDATEDPEELRQAQEELDAFKRNMNAPRKETGARLHYPEVE